MIEEEPVITIIEDFCEETKDILKTEDVILQRILASKAGKVAERKSQFKETCDYIYYSEINYSMKYASGKVWMHMGSKKGFTFDKKAGKVKVWFGSDIRGFTNMSKIHKYLKLDWLLNSSYYQDLLPIITKSIFEKIVCGKITNEDDLIKAWLKVNRMKFHSIKKVKVFIGLYKVGSLINLYKASTNPDRDLETYTRQIDSSITDGLYYEENFTDMILFDTIKQAIILKEKFNLSWSKKRLQEQHTLYTKKIMKYEINSMEDIVIEGTEDFIDCKNIKLLRTKKQVFQEGTEMNHCIYTNYFSSMKNKRYAAVSIFGKDRLTAGLIPATTGKDLVIQQIYSFYNNNRGISAFMMNSYFEGVKAYIELNRRNFSKLFSLDENFEIKFGHQYNKEQQVYTNLEFNLEDF